MSKKFHIWFAIITVALTVLGCSDREQETANVEWPEITSETKPWTRWWWHGSSVTKPDLTAELEAYSKAGMGGTEITPTYGARGHEASYIRYLTPEWTDMLIHVLNESQRLGMGVDMAAGTGWNFGGPTVTYEDAPQHMVYKKYTLSGGESLSEQVKCIQQPFARFVLNQVYTVGGSYTLPGETTAPYGGDPPVTQLVRAPSVSEIREPIGSNTNLQELAIDQINFEKELPLVVLMAYAEDGQILNLTGLVDTAGNLDWIAPRGNWKLYALFRGWTGKMVERAAPGGEGFMINHFSREALQNYLTNFDTAFAGKDISGLRAYFSDSYEVDDAKYYCDWCPGFLEEFRARRGYELTDFLPALFWDDEEELTIRILTDYRETVNDLIRENFTEEWHEWAAQQGKIIRNQSHGSPGNLLDLYAASDIPETEGKDLLRMKFATSAANVTGKKLVSSESATFLNENFTSTLLDLRQNLDRFFTAGVNHVFYHGTAFTPVDEPWPGWFFYVAIHLTPRNPIWQDLPAINHYASRIQSFMQSGKPDNDILLYFPVYDRYAEKEVGWVRNVDGDGPSQRMIERFNVDNPRWQESNVKKVMEELQKNGYAFDLISDMQLLDAGVSGDGPEVYGNTYRAVLVPECTFMPLETFSKLLSLAEKGATILFHNELPESVPGLFDLERREFGLERLKEKLAFSEPDTGVEAADLKKGWVVKGPFLPDLLAFQDIRRETMVEQGMQFNRRKDGEGTIYFILNAHSATVESWIPVASSGSSAVIFNPMTDRFGKAPLKKEGGRSLVYLHLGPAESCILKIYNVPADSVADYGYYRPAGEPVALDGPWNIRFIKGGPVLPAALVTKELQSWTNFSSEGVQEFSGTAGYTTEFQTPSAENISGYRLDLGEVHESARVILNDRLLGILTGPEYAIFIDRDDLQESNRLEIQVTNLAANRIAELDRSGAFWKKFYNNNLRPLRAENRGPDGMLTAAHWEAFDSGLMGPVTLIPVRTYLPE
ncbi:MAG: glycoside hydrolase family 2 protein [Bacteroidales bacterium]|nr:glycoside hydrolase family 2 protein [Bacteroidales bacterium]